MLYNQSPQHSRPPSFCLHRCATVNGIHGQIRLPVYQSDNYGIGTGANIQYFLLTLHMDEIDKTLLHPGPYSQARYLIRSYLEASTVFIVCPFSCRFLVV